MNERAIEDYHLMLDESSIEQAAETLQAGIERHRLSFGDRPICNVLRPFLLTSAQYDRVQYGSTMVLSAIWRLGRALIEDPELRSSLELTPDEEEIISIDPGYAAPDASGRLDAFFGPDGEFRFVEYNADSPGRLLFGDVLSEIFLEMDVVRRFSKNYPLRRIPIRPLILEALLASFEQWNRGRPNKMPHIAIVDWQEAPTRSEFEICRQFFESQGCPTMIVDPRELEYRGGFLRAGGFQIDLVYKRIVTSEYLENFDARHSLAAAARERAICVVNSFRVHLLTKKILFALLDDPGHEHLFTAAELQALRRHIPWTRRLREGFTTWQGRRIDLLDFVQAHREQLVLKPSGDYGGRGVVLGWECSEEGWSRSIVEALGAPYVVQERVPTSQETFPVLTAGGVEFEPRYLDLDPYTWRGDRIEGAGVRLSSSSLLNVTAGGGSAVPMLVINN